VNDFDIENFSKLVNDNLVVIFSMTTCPYCVETKRAFEDIGEKALVVEVDKYHPLVKHDVNKISSMKTYP